MLTCLNRSAKVIVNSSYSQAELEKMGVRKEKMVRINPPPNFVKHCSDQEFLKTFRKKFVDENTKIILSRHFLK